MKQKAVLLLSGGMDSTTLLYYLLNQGYQVYAITYNYGQKHNKEIESAKKICEITNTNHKIVDITSINQLLQGSSLTQEDMEIPKGHYQDESMRKTVVPNRNMILLSLAVGFAVSKNISEVAYAAHKGDHAIYPDCRPLFFEEMNHVTRLANYKPVKIIAPFLHKDKIEIARIGRELQVPFHLTWTCYEGKQEPCGKCGACIERREAMINIGIKE